MYDIEKIKKALQSAFEDIGLNSKENYQAVFHMVDWIEDLVNLIKFYENPESYNLEESGDIIIDFLSHAPHHLAVAYKLVIDEPV